MLTYCWENVDDRKRWDDRVGENTRDLIVYCNGIVSSVYFRRMFERECRTGGFMRIFLICAGVD